jgi:hypothetical protein
VTSTFSLARFLSGMHHEFSSASALYICSCRESHCHADVRVCRCEVGSNGTQLGGKPARVGRCSIIGAALNAGGGREVSASSPTVVACRFHPRTRGPVRSLATSGRAAPIGRRSLRPASCSSQ